jgi:hypothetical protein
MQMRTSDDYPLDHRAKYAGIFCCGASERAL